MSTLDTRQTQPPFYQDKMRLLAYLGSQLWML